MIRIEEYDKKRGFERIKRKEKIKKRRKWQRFGVFV